MTVEFYFKHNYLLADYELSLNVNEKASNISSALD